MTEPAYLTVEQIAEKLGLPTTKSVKHWIKAGELPAVNVAGGKRNKRWRVAPADLDAFLDKRKAVTPAPRVERRPRLANVTRYF